MRNAVCVFAGVCAVFAAVAEGQDNPRRRPGRPGSEPDAPKVWTLAELTGRLGLTRGQIAALQPIEEKVAEARRTLREQLARDLDDIAAEATRPPAKDAKDSKDTKNRRPPIDARTKARLAGAPLRELEEEWLDAVEAVLTSDQRPKLRELRLPTTGPARPTAPRPAFDNPAERYLAQVRELDLSDDQNSRLSPAIEAFRNRSGVALNTMADRVESLLTADQRQASEKLKASLADLSPRDRLFAALPRLSLTDEQKAAVEKHRGEAQAAIREAAGALEKELRVVLTEGQREKWAKMKRP
jgi:hypothetical protein